MPHPTIKENILAAWKKKFERWKTAKAPVDKAEVENLLRRVFAERFTIASGTSHQFHLDVSELVGQPGWILPTLPIPIRGGQKVLAPYLQRAYEAAQLLDLYPPPSDEDENDNETNRQESNPHEQDP